MIGNSEINCDSPRGIQGHLSFRNLLEGRTRIGKARSRRCSIDNSQRQHEDQVIRHTVDSIPAGILARYVLTDNQSS